MRRQTIHVTGAKSIQQVLAVVGDGISLVAAYNDGSWACFKVRPDKLDVVFKRFSKCLCETSKERATRINKDKILLPRRKVSDKILEEIAENSRSTFRSLSIDKQRDFIGAVMQDIDATAFDFYALESMLHA